MTDFRVTLKSNIKGVELNKKKVKIDCQNNKAGQLVVTTLNQNTAVFDGHKYEIKNASNANDFNVKFDSKEAAEDFYDNIVGILNDKSITPVESQKSGWQNFTAGVKDTVNKVVANVTGETTATDATAAPAITSLQNNEDTSSSSSSKMPLIIGGAVVLLLVIGLIVWKTRK